MIYIYLQQILSDVKPDGDAAQERIAELEQLVQEQATGLRVAKKDLDDQLKTAKQSNQDQLVEMKVLKQKMADVR